MKFSADLLTRPLPEGKSEAFFWDDDLPGFGLRVRAGGSRTWVVQYRVGQHQQRRVTIGSAAKVTPAEARKQARKLLAEATLGTDPQAEKRKRWQQRTMQAALFDRTDEQGEAQPGYLTWKKPRLRARSYLETERHLTKHCAPLHDKRLAEIEQADVSALLRKIEGKSGPVAANRVRSSLSAFFEWCMREGFAAGNPVALTNKAAKEEKPRERVLSDAELVEVWNACRDDSYGRIVRLAILTAARREEIGGLRRSEVDLDAKLWTLPAARVKNKTEHRVPLSEPAVDILSKALELNVGRETVFGEGEGAFSGWSKAKAALDQRILEARIAVAGKPKAAPSAPWTLHDLRRTALTGMARLGVDHLVLGHVANHRTTTKAGITLGVYVRHDFATEKRQALDRWADHVLGLICGKPSNVLALPARSA